MVDPQFLWTRVKTHGTGPAPSCCLSMVCWEERYLVVFGGGAYANVWNNAERAYSEVVVLDLDTHGWFRPDVKNADIGGPRFSHTAVVYKNRMIVLGGMTVGSNYGYLNDLVELDLTSWTWSRVHDVPEEPDGPGERQMHSAHVVGNRMYVIMGRPRHASTKVVWYLDLDTYTWHSTPCQSHRQLFNHPVFSLVGHGAAVEGPYLYLFGGYSNVFSRPVMDHVKVYSSALYRYDFRTDNWEELCSGGSIRPPGRYSCAMAVRNGVVFVFGGDASQSTVYFDDFWTIDTKEDAPAWKEVCRRISRGGPPDSARPSARSGSAYVTTRGALYILGGELPLTNVNSSLVSYTNELYRYPLALTFEVPLAVDCARWLSLVAEHRLNCVLDVESLPLRARVLLESHRPSAASDA